MSRAGEQLLAVDDVVVAINDCACLQSREIGPSTGLGVAKSAHSTSPLSILGSHSARCSSVPTFMIVGPTMFTAVPLVYSPPKLPISSEKMYWSMSDRPSPPYSSGQEMPRRPTTAQLAHEAACQRGQALRRHRSPSPPGGRD